MNNFFQINPAGSDPGIKVSGRTKTSSNMGNSLFSKILEKISSSPIYTKDSKISGQDSALTKGIIDGSGSDSQDNLLKEIVKNIDQSDSQSANLILSESAVPQLTAFLQGKGFSAEQVDKILISSRNDNGLLQIDKLMTSINSAGTANLSDDNGIVIESSFVPKVQEVLFKMGLGAGEVKETIEKSVNQNGELSLDKLTDALKEFFPEDVSESESASLFNRNNINFKSQTDKLMTSISSAGTGNLSDDNGIFIESSSIPKVQEVLFKMGLTAGEVNETIEKSVNQNGELSLINSAGTGNLSDEKGIVIEPSSIPKVQEVLFKMGLGAGEVKETIEKSVNQNGELSLDKLTDALKDLSPEGVSESESASLFNQNNINLKSQTDDINMTATDLKKGSNNLAEKLSQDSQMTDRQNIAAMLREKGISDKEIESFMKTMSADFSGSDTSESVIRWSSQDSSLLNQVPAKNGSERQEDNENNILDIFNDENTLNAGKVNKGLSRENGEIIKSFIDAMKQADQKISKAVIAGITEDNSTPETQNVESPDLKGGILNIKDVPSFDVTVQNIQKTSANVDITSQAKTAYNMPEPLPKVFDRMVIMIRNGEQTGRIKIQPPELGKLDIELSIKNGHIQANLSAENITVKGIIESNLNQLKQQLTDQGLIVEQFNVSVGSGNKQFTEDNNREWNGGDGSSQSGVSDIGDASSMMDEVIASSIINNQYRIDLHV